MKWLRHPVQSFNRKFICSYWEHKSSEDPWWRADQSKKRKCERCSEEMADI